jgi:predicted transcriptional regulator
MKITIIDGMPDGRTNIFRSSEAKAGLDRMDVAILGLLQNNARLSVKEIAAEVALAPSSTHERIKRMRDSGIALDQFTSRPGVTRIETSIIYEARRRYQLPVFQMED